MISLLSIFYTNQIALLIIKDVFVCSCTIEVSIPIWDCVICCRFCESFYFNFDLAN